MREADRLQLDQVLGLLRAVLGVDLIGAYLHGSGALGGLRPHSDLDVLAVARRTLTMPQRRRLVNTLLKISGSGRRGEPRPVELTVVVASQIRPWRYPPHQDFMYGQWLHEEYAAGVVPVAEANPDLVPLISMVLLGNWALVGPPPADLLEPVAQADLVRAITAGIDGLLADLDSDTANVILTFARIWFTVATAQIGLKDAAADWVIARVPEEHQAPVARARAIYLGEEEDRWDDLQTRVRPCVDHLRAAIRRT